MLKIIPNFAQGIIRMQNLPTPMDSSWWITRCVPLIYGPELPPPRHWRMRRMHCWTRSSRPKIRRTTSLVRFDLAGSRQHCCSPYESSSAMRPSWICSSQSCLVTRRTWWWVRATSLRPTAACAAWSWPRWRQSLQRYNNWLIGLI